MTPENFNDGVCEGCGNTGLAGDTCPECGGKMVSTGDVKQFEANDPEDISYPVELIKDEESSDTVPLEEADAESKDKLND